ncbi:MAG: hypothetical protein KC417_17120, partial [Myxococcales bacterium]|nr:hypothetical protein [Myxococcales bacterium]
MRAIAGAMLAAGLATACGSGPGTPAAAPTPTTTRDPAPREAIEVDVEGLPLGEFDRSDLEFSGLDRWGDRVVILPQYPERLGNALLAFDVTALDAFLDGRSAELPIEHVPFDGSAVELEFDAEPNLGVFEGYEAIAFAGDRVFLTVEV